MNTWEYGRLTNNHVNHCMFATSGEVIEAGDMLALAKELKVKWKEGDSKVVLEAKILDHLGAKGWELVNYAVRTTAKGSSVDVFVFKRRP